MKLWRVKAVEQNEIGLDFNFIKKKKMREDEENEQDGGQ